MTERGQAWKCDVCGNIISILHEGADSLVCCNQSMKLLEEKSGEEGSEKHVPVVERNEEGVLVRVGSVEHPMDEDHFIEWIEIFTEKGSSRKFLMPGEQPERMFPVKAEIVKARAYCNVHGLWSQTT